MTSLVAPTLHRLGKARASGPTVLLVHGMEDGWRSWQPLADLVDPDWRLYAADLPWRANGDYQWRRQGSPGDWLGALLRSRRTPVDVLVGHSLGANAVLEALTGNHSRRLAGAMLVAPFYCPPDLEITWPVFERSRRNFDQIIREGIEVQLGHRLARLEPDILASMHSAMTKRIGPVGFLTVFDQFLASGRLDLSEVTVPTMVVAGGRDPGLDEGRIQALRTELPDAHVVYEPEFGHFCQVRQVEAVARYLTGFVAKTCAGGKGGNT